MSKKGCNILFMARCLLTKDRPSNFLLTMKMDRWDMSSSVSMCSVCLALSSLISSFSGVNDSNKSEAMVSFVDGMAKTIACFLNF